MVRKASFCMAPMCILLACWIGDAPAAKGALPEGNAPPALMAVWFPDRVHEFVWRNWSLVEPAKLAKIIGASKEDVQAMGESMGLPPAVAIPPEMKTRGYITLIRRNWHLLPYDQLLEFLEMTPERLAFALREDDALWGKLGELKPKCEPLRYCPPDEAVRRRATEIKRVVKDAFGAELRRPAEPRFHFLRQFTTQASQSSLPALPVSDDDQLRFLYSYFAVFGDPLSTPELDPYPDGLLQRLSAVGINGVWLHVVLRDLAPGDLTFPEFGAGHEQRLANLRALVNRAKKYGIGVYLYVNEPRAMPEAFFRNRPEMAGVQEGDFRALCTSHPAVRQWMSDALAHVFHAVPGLAGVFTITASENLTNCDCHCQHSLCLHCKSRSTTDIIAEVNSVIEEGVHRSNPKAKVIVWDWSWEEGCKIDSPKIISRLPKSAWLMSMSEFGLPINRGGIKASVNEYSVSAPGPGPRATWHWKLAKEAGLKTAAKVQLNNSWELSTVPYLPVMDLVAEHCHNLALAGVDGMMLSWTHGGYPSPNLEIAARFRAKPTPSIGEVLDALAVERYGAEGAPLARKAWAAFSTAFQEYPFNAPSVLYLSPVHVGPANPLYLKSTGYSATMTGIPYDSLTMWRGPYPFDVFVGQFEKVAEGWRSGIPHLEAALAKAPPERRDEARAEVRFARVAAIHFQSVANQARFIAARDALTDSSKTLSEEERQHLQSIIKRSLQSEIALARQEFTLAQEDSRIGFEAANQYFFLPLDLVEKVINCRWLLGNCGE